MLIITTGSEDNQCKYPCTHRAGKNRKAPASRVPGRHIHVIQPGHVWCQAICCCHQPLTGELGIGHTSLPCVCNLQSVTVDSPLCFHLQVSMHVKLLYARYSVLHATVTGRWPESKTRLRSLNWIILVQWFWQRCGLNPPVKQCWD